VIPKVVPVKTIILPVMITKITIHPAPTTIHTGAIIMITTKALITTPTILPTLMVPATIVHTAAMMPKGTTILTGRARTTGPTTIHPAPTVPTTTAMDPLTIPMDLPLTIPMDLLLTIPMDLPTTTLMTIHTEVGGKMTTPMGPATIRLVTEVGGTMEMIVPTRTDLVEDMAPTRTVAGPTIRTTVVPTTILTGTIPTTRALATKIPMVPVEDMEVPTPIIPLHPPKPPPPRVTGFLGQSNPPLVKLDIKWMTVPLKQ
jgi:hypothetical protein